MISKKNAIVISILSCFLLLILSSFFYIRGKKASLYKNAEKCIRKGDLDSAWQIFSSIEGYKDSRQRLSDLEKKDFLLPLRNTPKYELVTFGRFEQDAYETSGAEAIEWIVLDRIDNHILLLSYEILTTRPYNSDAFKEITWEDSDLRFFLNNDFYESAFNDQEKEIIVTVLNENADQSLVQTAGGNDTKDKVFLLSETEYGIYINDDISIEDIGKTSACQYASLLGTKVDENGFSPWWLRSPGVYPYSAQFVTSGGELYLSGAYVDIEKGYGVRPAIWVKVADDMEEDDAYFE